MINFPGNTGGPGKPGGGVDKIVKFALNKLEDLLQLVMQISIEDLAELYSNDTDELIKSTIQTEKLNYISGKFIVTASDDLKKYMISVDLYFQDASQQWILKNRKSDWLPIEQLKEKSIKELATTNPISFEVKHP
jgi:hypothetical protein